MDGSVATVSDTGKKRFADLVRLHAQKAKFITREQEKRTHGLRPVDEDETIAR